jgi:DNA-binding YbaB/EbfC family protein
MTDLPTPDGLPDLGGLMDQLQKMQEAQAVVHEGHAGGGAVKITADGAFQFQTVTISKDAVDPDDVGMLEDLVLAALHDLSSKLAEAQRQAMGAFDPSRLGDALGGLGGFGGLGGHEGLGPSPET